MRKYDTVLFDLDGTLLDTLPDLKSALNFALREAGYPTRTTEEVRAFVGSGLYNLVKRAMPAGTDEALLQNTTKVLKSYYLQHLVVETVPYDGMLQLMAKLKADGFKIAIVSNKADAPMQEIGRHFFADLAGFVLGEREDVPRKPAPDMVRLALDALGADAARAVYVGDSEVDVQTARNSGTGSVCVDWGFRDREDLVAAGAEVICSSVAELEAALYAEG